MVIVSSKQLNKTLGGLQFESWGWSLFFLSLAHFLFRPVIVIINFVKRPGCTKGQACRHYVACFN